jgi:hypothetical protein
MMKKKKTEYEICSPEIQDWIKQLEREEQWEDLKKCFPYLLIGLILVLFIVGFFQPFAFIVAMGSSFGLVIYFVISSIPITNPPNTSKEVVHHEQKVIHHHYYPTKLTEVKEVRARLPNGAELSVKHGRKHE